MQSKRLSVALNSLIKAPSINYWEKYIEQHLVTLFFSLRYVIIIDTRTHIFDQVIDAFLLLLRKVDVLVVYVFEDSIGILVSPGDDHFFGF